MPNKMAMEVGMTEVFLTVRKSRNAYVQADILISHNVRHLVTVIKGWC